MGYFTRKNSRPAEYQLARRQDCRFDIITVSTSPLERAWQVASMLIDSAGAEPREASRLKYAPKCQIFAALAMYGRIPARW